jgi:hypothetical protein
LTLYDFSDDGRFEKRIVDKVKWIGDRLSKGTDGEEVEI